MANSKCYVSFKNKMSHFDADLEYIDIIYNDILSNPLSEDADELFSGSNNPKYEILSKYKIVPQNQLLVVRHLRSTLYTAYIKDLYEEFTLYLRNILKDIYKNAKITPERLTGEHKINMSSVEILTHITNGDLIDIVIDNIFQSLENERSTIALIEKFHNKIGIEKNDQLITNAIYYLEIRHKLVHTDGHADNDFKKTHPTISYTASDYISLNYTTIKEAKESVSTLVQDIDKKIMQKSLVLPNTASCR